MSGLGLIGILVSVLLIGAGLWFGWQLLRQNGRILLRLDELEKRLDELEFAESSEPVVETVEPDANQPSAADGYPLTRSGDHPLPVGRGERGGEGQRETHFGNRSLARSKLKRDGLKAGTSAPSFRLPRLDGGELSLEELRGKRVLLVFSDLHCGPCQVLAPHLGKFHREHA